MLYVSDYKRAWTERVRNTTLAWLMQSSNAWNAELFGHSGFCWYSLVVLFQPGARQRGRWQLRRLFRPPLPGCRAQMEDGS